MTSPWLRIPLADYEGHMALAEVAQAQLLSGIFAEVLKEHAPRSVAVLGCAGGNGFAEIDSTITPRVAGVDINPDYIAQTRARFQGRIPTLELYVGDVQDVDLVRVPVDLVYAALVFEYVDAGATLNRIRSMLNPGGVLVSLVQLPAAGTSPVTLSPFPTLQTLAACMRPVSPGTLGELAASRGFESGPSRRVESSAGRSFQVQAFRAR